MQQTLKVTGLSCSHCVHSIQTAIKQIGGAATVNITKGIVVVEHDPSSVSLDTIKQAITNLGYDVE